MAPTQGAPVVRLSTDGERRSMRAINARPETTGTAAQSFRRAPLCAAARGVSTVPLESAEDCDAKAARARAIAERLTDPDAINTMLRIAWYYDWRAAYAR